MRFAEPTVVSAVYALADHALTRALMTRVRDETVELLGSSAEVPRSLLEEVFASGDPGFLAALAASSPGRGEVFDRLAALGDPELALILYGTHGNERTPAQRAAVWKGAATTADDPRWRTEDALPARLLASDHRDLLELLEPALLSPFPELVAHARRVIDHSGGESTVERYWRKACPKTLPELIDALRDSTISGRDIDLPAGVVDWDVLLAEQRREPFGAKELRRMWQHPDCPEELAMAAFECSENDRPSGATYWSMLTSPALDELADHSLAQLFRAGVESGVFPVDRLLSEIGPARRTLGGLPDGHDPTETALAAQAARLGSDFAPWRAVYALLPRFQGSVTELVDAALAEAPEHEGRPWPKPLGPETPSRKPAKSRAAWLRLYSAAGHSTQCALGGHMDVRTVQQLVFWQEPSAELRSHLVRSRGESVRVALASDWNTPQELIEELIPFNEPAVNAALFLETDLTPAQRRHILSGRRWADGVSADTPSAERLELRDSLVGGLRSSARRHWLLACADSGDPLLCRILLGSLRVKIHTSALELHMLIRLWERHGPDAVRELLDETDFPGRKRPARHPLSQATSETGRAALEADGSAGPGGGPALLRAAYEKAVSPEGRAEFLCEKGFGSEGDEFRDALSHLEEEVGPGPVPWAELEARHHVKALDDRLLDQFRPGVLDPDDLEGCPAALTEASAAAALRMSHRHYRPRRGAEPPTIARMLEKLPLPLMGGECEWLEKAHRRGLVTLDEVVRTGFPAHATVAFLAKALAPRATAGADPDGDAEVLVETEEIREARRAVVALASEHLSDNPDAWALALQLIPEFEGTLPDLLRASGAVVS
ncbi:hypothetical protein [Streptomyces sp. NPDC058653]|uniref:hypothetical protein n=1 Tax=Streptomyces sp. NPDC058653 TaxID=3346576 RepID=UPI00365C0C10